MSEAPLPDGRTKKFLRVGRADSVHIIAFVDDKKILLLREFRPFYGEYIWMLPTGRADKETDIAEAAQRELQEETGYRADTMKFWCNSNVSESLIMTNQVFIAHGLHKDPLPQDHDELMETHEFTVEEALQKVLKSPRVHAASAYALLRYLYEQKR